ncbi:MAG: hypothetical protein PHU24_09085 [Sphaerochaetaceae bacterium]|jgi:hypothetical protein|nr:hypothetical protein [Sphaerochaetaceae bacterium]NLO60441.1 hypothetical protein [Spirochaetales bacterium]MDD2406596.1 hypothetical protein [Sphaerochaetaceae bacterium]MDD3671485.1 hypothetical protein [Sphaerochaetaceae bacterium]MDD4259569.1 hypothetical protein [Sphaerochaetaceae bacterium]
MGSCHFCGTKVPTGLVIGNATLCSFCGRPLKVCLNCRFYDKNAYHECREEIDEPVIYKDLANFCDFFVLNEGSSEASVKSQEEARSKFLSLFND